ncbi:unnamed protein product [Boreogadus saida]
MTAFTEAAGGMGAGRPDANNSRLSSPSQHRTHLEHIHHSTRIHPALPRETASTRPSHRTLPPHPVATLWRPRPPRPPRPPSESRRRRRSRSGSPQKVLVPSSPYERPALGRTSPSSSRPEANLRIHLTS